jgi:SUMO ligase MMS21 Smc5/6 complex component
MSEIYEKLEGSSKPKDDSSFGSGLGIHGDISFVSATASLTCPISLQRMTIPVKSIHCSHLQVWYDG